MDRATIFGLVGTIGLSIYCMDSVAATLTDATQPHMFLQPQALVLVFLGSIFCAMTSVSWTQFTEAMRAGRKCVVHTDVRYEDVIPKLVEYATIAKRDGKVPLERSLSQAEYEDPFLMNGLKLAASGKSGEKVDAELRAEMAGITARHERSRQVYVRMGKYAPAFGLLTTLIGEVVMFDSLKSGVTEVAPIATGMAVALLGTLYGVMLANFIYMPFADKLQSRSRQEMFVNELYLQTAKSVAMDENPLFLYDTLCAFLDNTTVRRLKAIAE